MCTRGGERARDTESTDSRGETWFGEKGNPSCTANPSVIEQLAAIMSYVRKRLIRTRISNRDLATSIFPSSPLPFLPFFCHPSPPSYLFSYLSLSLSPLPIIFPTNRFETKHRIAPSPITLVLAKIRIRERLVRPTIRSIFIIDD